MPHSEFIISGKCLGQNVYAVLKIIILNAIILLPEFPFCECQPRYLSEVKQHQDSPSHMP